MVFLLLIFFSVPATFHINSNLIIGLPITESKRLTDTEKLSTRLVAKERQRFLYWPRVTISLKCSLSVIAKERGGLSPPDIVVSADELASHKSVVAAIEAAAYPGFEEIFLQTSLEEKSHYEKGLRFGDIQSFACLCHSILGCIFT